MTPGQNLMSMYHRTGYRHAPVSLNMCPSLWEHYRSIAGDTPMEEYFEYPEGFGEAMVNTLKLVHDHEVDWSAYYPDGLKEGVRIDPWGVAHEPGSADAVHMTRMRHPMGSLDSLEQLQAYPFPTHDPASEAVVREHVEYFHGQGKAAVGLMGCTIWETSWYMRDMAMLMMDMSMGDDKATFLLDRVTDLSCERAAALARAGIDIIYTGDDIGTQNAIMMSLEMYREWLKPRLTKVIAAAKDIKPDILIHYHSCGYVEPFIPDLIEAGIDILNPVQPECMDFGRLHDEYGDIISFNGTLGTQSTMPFGTPDDVRSVVRKNLGAAGPKGGLLCCPTHLLEPEVPWDNIVAYVNACKEHS